MQKNNIPVITVTYRTHIIGDRGLIRVQQVDQRVEVRGHEQVRARLLALWGEIDNR